MEPRTPRPDYCGWLVLMGQGELAEDAAAAFTDWLTERGYQEFLPGEPVYHLPGDANDGAAEKWCVAAGPRWVVVQSDRLNATPYRLRRHRCVTDAAFAAEFLAAYRAHQAERQREERVVVPAWLERPTPEAPAAWLRARRGILDGDDLTRFLVASGVAPVMASQMKEQLNPDDYERYVAEFQNKVREDILNRTVAHLQVPTHLLHAGNVGHGNGVSVREALEASHRTAAAPEEPDDSDEKS